MSGKILARASAISLALILAACGGDDSSTSIGGVSGNQNQGGDNTDGNTDTGGDTGGGTETPEGITVGTISVSATPVQIGTNSTAESEIVAYVKDTNNVLVPDVPVQFSADENSSLQISRSLTDETGSALAILKPLNDPRNRVASITAAAGEQTATISISITGTSIAIDGPSAISAGNTASFTATLSDSANMGIPQEDISISNSNSGNTISFATNTTGNSGEVQFTLSANNPGTDTITITAYSGETGEISASTDISITDNSFQFSSPSVDQEIPLNTPQNVTLEWTDGGNGISGETVSFSSTRGTLSATTQTTGAGGTATISIQADTAGPATIIAEANDPLSGLTISTQRTVEFVATNPAVVTAQASKTQLKANEQSRITAVVRDASGNLVKNQVVEFKIERDVSGGNLSSATSTTNSLGRASVTFTAGQSATGRDDVLVSTTVRNTGITDNIPLTVSSGALRLSIGTGNELEEPDADHYIKDWVVYVSDANGVPVQGQTVEVSVVPVAYRKGDFVQVDSDGDGEVDRWAAFNSFTCPTEDINGNGQLDATETDTNNSGAIEPTNEAVVFIENDVTDVDGAAHFDIRYPQSSCAWVDVKVEARTNVSGSEYGQDAIITLPCLAFDLSDPDITPPAINTANGTSDVEGRYGNVSSCSTND